MGEKLADFVKSEKPMIKKGEFGYLLQEEFSIQSLLGNDILIGVYWCLDMETATDTFRTVGTSIEGVNNIKRTINNVFDYGFDVKDYDHTVGVYGLENIPSNATAFFTYQLSIIEDDEDDDGIRPDGSLINIHPECMETRRRRRWSSIR